MSEEVKIISEGTPNPNALKFVLDKIIIESGSANFPSKESCSNSPLAKRLFEINSIEEVFIGKQFITITKKQSALWESIYNEIIDRIKNHISNGDPVITGEIKSKPGSTGNIIEDKIREILDTQIRPAVASDGGDVIFNSFDDGILKLHLQGACSSCPSSTMTLKHGIEQMLKRQIPEIKEVISI